MDVECCPQAEEGDVISKDPPSIGPEGENISLPTPDSTIAPELPETISTTESGTSNQDEEQKDEEQKDEEQKESKIRTLKRLVVGKGKPKNDEDKNEEKTHTSRALRKSLSRVFSVSSSSLGRVWSSFSATRIHSEGETGTSTKSFGKIFGKKNKQESEKEPGSDNVESKSHTLGRRLSATFRSAFGRSKEA